MAGKVIYIGGDAFGGKLPDGKHWVKLDLAAEASKQGIDLDALGGQAAQDPSAALEYLKGAGTSRQVGTATIDGTPTTRFNQKVDAQPPAEDDTLGADEVLGQQSPTTNG
jgi:hypothetical protein